MYHLCSRQIKEDEWRTKWQFKKKCHAPVPRAPMTAARAGGSNELSFPLSSGAEAALSESQLVPNCYWQREGL